MILSIFFKTTSFKAYFFCLIKKSSQKKSSAGEQSEAVATGRQYNFFYFSSIIFCHFWGYGSKNLIIY
ncbi:hypothetical protein EDM02_00400 [Candidatus Cardinium hertigii]|jgi:hypothetical protein|uniref:Uncharacterized protein n=1 Tax=Candidatus Cardinium hertigii TaxID=247481 RepID=A0A3N2QDE3_9BACT|nr:hypothetical protein EDM02_00400 [Candidatus Cardinium hertigii]